MGLKKKTDEYTIPLRAVRTFAVLLGVVSFGAMVPIGIVMAAILWHQAGHIMNRDWPNRKR